MLKIEIVNVVATAETGESIDLKELSQTLEVIYNPSKYRCAYFKDDKMQGKVSVFPSGKMIALGATSEESARRDLLHVLRLLSVLGVSTKTMKFEVQNIVITVDLEMSIDLEALQEKVPGITYEPEQFPGAIFRPQVCNATALLFGSGKMVVAGLKSASDAEETVKRILDELGGLNAV